MVFNISMMAVAASMANLIWNASLAKQSELGRPYRSLCRRQLQPSFWGKPFRWQAIIKLSENTSMRRAWRSIVQLSFPYYVVSAGMTSMLNLVGHRFGWQAAMVVFPVMYGIHHSYRLYFGRISEALTDCTARENGERRCVTRMADNRHLAFRQPSVHRSSRLRSDHPQFKNEKLSNPPTLG